MEEVAYLFVFVLALVLRCLLVCLCVSVVCWGVCLFLAVVVWCPVVLCRCGEEGGREERVGSQQPTPKCTTWWDPNNQPPKCTTWWDPNNLCTWDPNNFQVHNFSAPRYLLWLHKLSGLVRQILGYSAREVWRLLYLPRAHNFSWHSCACHKLWQTWCAAPPHSP